MDFTKMQSAGNDYVVVNSKDTERDWSSLAIAVCERNFGIGADSLLVLLPSDKADFRMRIFDTDGSEAEACGNGIRSLARYVFEKGMVNPEANEIMVETLAGIRRVKLEKENGRLTMIQANMGKPEFQMEKIPAAIKEGNGRLVDIKSMLSYTAEVGDTELNLNLVSMGNPHAVYFYEHPVGEFPMNHLGPRVENLGIFPNRTNFEVARVLGPNCIEARVWERGVGETLACGSGACAITVASRLLGFTEPRVEIKLPGGTLIAEWNGEGELLLSGPAEIVFEGTWPD